jgi:hypothetical protein
MTQTAKLLRNAIQTPDGTILESRNRHDFQAHTDTISGEYYFVDGGLDYCRGTINTMKAKSLHLYNTDTHEVLRKNITWGSYGKNGKQPLRLIPVADMETEHLEAVLKNCPYAYPQILDLMRAELEYRQRDK